MPWTSFSALFTPEADTAISDGQPILATQIEALYNRSDAMLDWFKAANEPYGMPGKINLFTSTSSEASIRIPPGVDTTSALSAGDLWNVGGVLKFRSAGDQTKTIAFTDSTFTAFTANSLSVTTTSTLSGRTAVAKTDDPAFVVRRDNTDPNNPNSFGLTAFQVNTASNTVELRNGTSFSIFNVSNNSSVFNVSNTGAVNGTIDLTANVVVSPTLQTSATAQNGVTRITNASGIQRYSTTISPNNWENFGTPEVIHTGGFTINIGNGVQAISATAQLPAVTIPYACSAVSWTITTNDTASASLTGVTVSLKIQKRTSGNNNNSFTDVTGTTMELTTTANSQASGTFTNVTFSQGDTLRLVATGTPTAKAVAVHIRVRRTA